MSDERLITADGVEVAEGQTVWYFNLPMPEPTPQPANATLVGICYSNPAAAIELAVKFARDTQEWYEAEAARWGGHVTRLEYLLAARQPA